jgi:hypothetical protein
MEKIRIRDGKIGSGIRDREKHPGSATLDPNTGSELACIPVPVPPRPKVSVPAVPVHTHNTEISEVVLWIRTRFGTGYDLNLPLVN